MKYAVPLSVFGRFALSLSAKISLNRQPYQDLDLGLLGRWLDVLQGYLGIDEIVDGLGVAGAFVRKALQRIAKVRLGAIFRYPVNLFNQGHHVPGLLS